MKTESECNFEKALANLKREALPASWKSEMLDRALSAKPRNVSSFKLTANLTATGFLVACWVAIAFLKLTTPVDPTGQNLAERYGVTEEQIPLIAQHFATRFQLPNQ